MMLINYNYLHNWELEIFLHASELDRSPEEFGICPACEWIYDLEKEHMGHGWCACDYE